MWIWRQDNAPLTLNFCEVNIMVKTNAQFNFI